MPEDSAKIRLYQQRPDKETIRNTLLRFARTKRYDRRDMLHQASVRLDTPIEEIPAVLEELIEEEYIFIDSTTRNYEFNHNR